MLYGVLLIHMIENLEVGQSLTRIARMRKSSGEACLQRKFLAAFRRFTVEGSYKGHMLQPEGKRHLYNFDTLERRRSQATNELRQNTIVEISLGSGLAEILNGDCFIAIHRCKNGCI